MRQAYLLRGPITARVRVAEGQPARITVKAPRADGGRFEWEWPVPGALARALLRLPLPRVEKVRSRAQRLDVDVLCWPPGIVLVELELEPHELLDLCDPAARARAMEAHRPPWVRAWRDVTDDPHYTNAQLARRMSRERPGSLSR
jgi:CYTH domain-containing protein